MAKRLLLIFLSVFLCAGSVFAQGLETAANKNDWEEINFEFDSAVLSDGYPSLLRLAELLNQNADYRVSLRGHTDFRGSDQYNVGLGRRRAEMVQTFLVKYGARDTQIGLETLGEGVPKVSNDTVEGRFMNRRVVLTVTDGQGRTISDGGVGQAIESIEKATDCCDEILSKLDKLDEILDLLKNLRNENDKLKQDVADLKGQQGDLGDRVAKLPEPPTAEQVTQAVREALPEPDRFQVLNLNAGPDLNSGNVSFSGKGRYFQPFGRRSAVQAEGEFLHYFGRNEGQFDIGLVNRWGHLQAGGFASFKYVKFAEWQRAGGLGQASVSLDYVFDRGRVGFYGTKGFIDGAVVDEAILSRNILSQTYLSVVDQVGISTTFGAWGDTWFEGNAGALFRRGGGNKPGGTLRYIHPLNESVAFTVEGGLNETYVSSNNTGRIVFGLQFGNWLRPQNYNTGETERPVPVEIPRVRYEVLSRTIRTGNDQPVADAGGDQIGVTAGAISLDGSASFDPDDDPITFAWVQVSGPPVDLTGANTAVASFTADEGNTYMFRLTVRDNQNGVATDRVTVSTTETDINIKRFNVTPSQVEPGASVTISWEVEGADTVEITELGPVNPSGTSQVAVTQTTTFTLTARNASREVSENLTVTVQGSAPRILRFNASPLTINEGQSSVISWETAGADQVTIDQIGSVGTSGSATVSPAATTAYTITATNAFGSVSSTLSIDVVAPGMPRILNFVASPQEVLPGEQSVLTWEVENATSVSITDLGTVDLAGTSTVTPEETRSYILTASNGQGEVTATVTVTVLTGVRIVNFTADKTVVKNPGDPATLTWSTENAIRVVITGVGDVEPNGSIVVNPVSPTTYTLLAYGRRGEISAVLAIGVENENTSPVAIAEAPVAILVPAGTLVGLGTLDGSKSYDPDGDPITYEWRAIGARTAAVKNPTAVRPTVEFSGGYGEYIFELMVTDDKGAMDRDVVTVHWVDP
ncbi:MAG: OmpA family protein [Bryobacterales bacterium]